MRAWSHPPAILALAIAAAVSGPANAQSLGEEAPRGWSGDLSLGLHAAPDFEGSRTTRKGVMPNFDLVYRADGLGRVTLGGQGLGWTFAETPDWSLGVGLGIDPGRRQRAGDSFRPGSPRLAGMGDIAAAPTLSLSGSYGPRSMPLNVSLKHALGSYRGTLLEVGTAIPWQLAPKVALVVSPGVSWSDRRYAQAFFGVDAVQAAATGRPRFDAHAGLENVRLGAELDLALDRRWHVVASAQYKRLLDDAADSPVVERKGQTSGGLRVEYRF
jgi:outer membrane scaffolding protein for murein synthesis (MipA/OmpV family)